MYVKKTLQRYETGNTMDLCWLTGGFWRREDNLPENLDLIECVAAAFRENANYFDLLTKNKLGHIKLEISYCNFMILLLQPFLMLMFLPFNVIWTPFTLHQMAAMIKTTRSEYGCVHVPASVSSATASKFVSIYECLSLSCPSLVQSFSLSFTELIL